LRLDGSAAPLGEATTSPTVPKVCERLTPRITAPPTTANAIAAKIKPYSTAVDPRHA
jgi:hypothetical protein